MNCPPQTAVPCFNIGTPAPSCEPDSAQGIVAGQSQVAASFKFPLTTTTFVVPAIGALAQVSVVGAAGWAQPGLLVWMPSHGGYLSVTGSSGDLITLRNLTILAGSVIQVGTPVIPAAPPQSVAEGQVSTVTAASSIKGVFEGLPVEITPALGTLLIGNGSVWTRLVASPFIPLSTQPTLVTVKRDVLASTTGTTSAARWAAPVWGGSASSPAPATTTFPSFPTVPAGIQLRALVQCNWKVACLVSGTLCIEVTINGVTSKIVNYMQAADEALATLPANIRHQGPEGQFQIMIPVPSDNAAVNVSTYVRKYELVSGDANTHYILDYKVLGYFA